MMEPDGALQEALAARDGVLLSWDEAHGEPSATIARDALLDTCAWLKEAQGFMRLSGIVGIDTLTYPIAMPGQVERGTPRFGIIYHLAARPPKPGRLRIRIFAPADDPVVPSVTGLWPGADFFEREIYDLFGVQFSGHPNLRRIMMPEDYPTHPLRKDIGIGGEPVEFTHTFAAIEGARRKANA